MCRVKRTSREGIKGRTSLPQAVFPLVMGGSKVQIPGHQTQCSECGLIVLKTNLMRHRRRVHLRKEDGLPLLKKEKPSYSGMRKMTSPYNRGSKKRAHPVEDEDEQFLKKKIVCSLGVLAPVLKDGPLGTPKQLDKGHCETPVLKDGPLGAAVPLDITLDKPAVLGDGQNQSGMPATPERKDLYQPPCSPISSASSLGGSCPSSPEGTRPKLVEKPPRKRSRATSTAVRPPPSRTTFSTPSRPLPTTPSSEEEVNVGLARLYAHKVSASVRSSRIGYEETVKLAGLVRDPAKRAELRDILATIGMDICTKEERARLTTTSASSRDGFLPTVTVTSKEGGQQVVSISSGQGWGLQVTPVSQ